MSTIQLSGGPVIEAGVRNGESMSESPTMEKTIPKFPSMVKCPSRHGHKEKTIPKTSTMAKRPCRHGDMTCWTILRVRSEVAWKLPVPPMQYGFSRCTSPNVLAGTGQTARP